MRRTGLLYHRTTCRLCDAEALQSVLSLGATPLANEFVPGAQRGQPQDRFPLEVFLCTQCGHVQLLDVVDPERLFRNYVYVSSTSAVFVEHFRRYAEWILQLTAMPRGSQVIEIGSNDGTLLRFFQEAGMRVLGIDPAQAIAAEATKRGLETLPAFFDVALAKRLKQQGWEADLIAANNVFAHADDLHEVAQGVAHLLKPEGLFVFEVSYLVDVLEKTLFDTIYHEHLSYHTVKPLTAFFARHGLEFVDAMRVDSHGGSLRGIVKRTGGSFPSHGRMGELLALEARLGLERPQTYGKFATMIHQRKAELVQLLQRLKRDGKRVAGFGAPAKATTLMFHFGIGPDALDYIVDDSPWKQGLYSPGHHIPVVPSESLYNGTKPDYVLILAWNFAQPIMNAHRAFAKAGGHFIVPLPQLAVY